LPDALQELEFSQLANRLDGADRAEVLNAKRSATLRTGNYRCGGRWGDRVKAMGTTRTRLQRLGAAFLPPLSRGGAVGSLLIAQGFLQPLGIELGEPRMIIFRPWRKASAQAPADVQADEVAEEVSRLVRKGLLNKVLDARGETLLPGTFKIVTDLLPPFCGRRRFQV
jgi:hypothetical protein